jgi:hypothetical protein
MTLFNELLSRTTNTRIHKTLFIKIKFTKIIHFFLNLVLQFNIIVNKVHVLNNYCKYVRGDSAADHFTHFCGSLCTCLATTFTNVHLLLVDIQQLKKSCVVPATQQIGTAIKYDYVQY